jgi:hypothetical protein
VSRPRKMSVRIITCETKTGWSNSTMTFSDYERDRPTKVVTLQIESPYDLLYIEEQIAKIRAEWKRQMERT